MKNRILCLAAALCLLAGLLSACGGKPETGAPLFAERGEPERAPLGNYVPARDAQALREALASAGQTHAAELDEAEAERQPGLPLEISRSRDGDTVITDGAYLYMLDSYGLVILSAAGKDSRLLSYTQVPRDGNAWGYALYQKGDRIAVLYNADGENAAAESCPRVHAVLLDVSDRGAPVLLTQTALEGSLVEACLVGDRLCLTVQRSFLTLPREDEALLPRLWEGDRELSLRAEEIYLSPEPAKSALTLVAALRMEDGRIQDALAFTDGVEAVRGSGEELYLSRTLWSETASAPYSEAPYTVVDYSAAARTEILRLSLGERLSLTGGCVLEGALADAAALDLRGGTLRVVTELDSRSFSAYTDEAHGWTNYEIHSHTRESRLTILDAQLNVTGGLTKLGGAQGVSACGFAGDTLWLSAAGDSDRVYTASLSASAPAMTGSLPAEGRSLLLRAFGEGLVLGISAPEAGEDWRVLMYDVSDPTQPREADSLSLKDWVPAGGLSDTAALFSDGANCLLGFPVEGKENLEYLLIRWTGSKLKLQGAFAPEYVPANARGLLLDGLLYICSPLEVYVTDPETMTILSTVSNVQG